MLYIIGLGIADELDMSLRGLAACQNSDKVFVELYTAMWPGSLPRLEKKIGKKITKLERKDLEEDSVKFIRNVKKSNISLLVPGDPLAATTHINLILEAKKNKIPYQIIHSSSIMTAIAETGLNLYNFGKTVTIVRPEKRYAPTSFYDAGVSNKKKGLHTLFLLDIDMDANEGLKILLEIERKKKKGLISPGMKIIAASGIGSISLGKSGRSGIAGTTGKTVIKYEKAENLLQQKPMMPPAVIIIPGSLHFIEKDFLETL
jgi:diphthine synthase